MTPPGSGVWMVLLCALALLSGCTTLRDDLRPPRPSQAIARDTPGLLKDLAYRDDDGRSGFVLLEEGLDALSARLWMTDHAQHTLDVQVYIFHGDKTGALLAGALLRAAQRGVRVRVLLDDIYSEHNETELIALDSHPKIEVRLFNPFRYRGGNLLTRAYEYVAGSGRVNRRMHNKLYIADNQMGIAGGRNIGDEYFEANQGLAFLDLDVLASGPVVQDMSKSFDAYWNSSEVVRARALPRYREARQQLPVLTERLAALRLDLFQTDYGRSLALRQVGERLARGELAWLPGRASLIADPPEKIEGKSPLSQLMVGQLAGLRLDPRQDLLLVSPYFIPGRLGSDWLAYWRAHGVEVRVLTNSLAATDVPLVHAGYARYRVDLLKAGVRLYELKPVENGPPKTHIDASSGASRASLHAKTFVFDRRHVFVGSFNFDPRSALLNTELGVVIDSPDIAGRVIALAEDAMEPSRSHRVELKPAQPGAKPQLIWFSRNPDGELVSTDTEPNSTRWQRFLLELFLNLPIEQDL
jgi:putative cardiolipin synthase